MAVRWLRDRLRCYQSWRVALPLTAPGNAGASVVVVGILSHLAPLKGNGALANDQFNDRSGNLLAPRHTFLTTDCFLVSAWATAFPLSPRTSSHLPATC